MALRATLEPCSTPFQLFSSPLRPCKATHAMRHWRPPKNPLYYPKTALSSTLGACIPSYVASVMPMTLPVAMNCPIITNTVCFECAIYAIQCLWQYCRLPSLCSILFEGCNRLPWGTLFSQGFCLLLNCF